MMGWYVLDSSGSGQVPMAGCFKHGNEPTCSVKYWEFLESPSDCWLLENSSATRSQLVVTISHLNCHFCGSCFFFHVIPTSHYKNTVHFQIYNPEHCLTELTLNILSNLISLIYNRYEHRVCISTGH
jgi:NAD-dependent dihydropyrimidine dehydrogenase PreA subunit